MIQLTLEMVIEEPGDKESASGGMGQHTIEVGELCMLLPRKMAEAMGHALEAGHTVRLRKVGE